jgi:hypothetical protein
MFTMVDMNELEAAIQSIQTTLKKFNNNEAARHTEYLQSCSTDVLHMDRIEAQLAALLMVVRTHLSKNQCTPLYQIWTKSKLGFL